MRPRSTSSGSRPGEQVARCGDGGVRFEPSEVQPVGEDERVPGVSVAADVRDLPGVVGIRAARAAATGRPSRRSTRRACRECRREERTLDRHQSGRASSPQRGHVEAEQVCGLVEQRGLHPGEVATDVGGVHPETGAWRPPVVAPDEQRAHLGAERGGLQALFHRRREAAVAKCLDAPRAGVLDEEIRPDRRGGAREALAAVAAGDRAAVGHPRLMTGPRGALPGRGGGRARGCSWGRARGRRG